MSQTAHKQGMLAWDWPTNYVIYMVVVHCETRCVISRVFVICRRPKCGRQKWLNNCQFHVIQQRCLKLWFEIENSFLWLDLYTIVKNHATSRIVYRIKLYSITLVKYVFHTHIFNTLKMTLIWPVVTVCTQTGQKKNHCTVNYLFSRRI